MKYSITKNTIQHGKETFYQIQAEKDFTLFDGTEIHKGDLGGYIDLGILGFSQDDNSWIMDSAQVYGNAYIGADVIVRDNAKVSGYAHLEGNTIVRNNAEVGGHATVVNSEICGGYLTKERKTEGATVFFGDKFGYTVKDLRELLGYTQSEFSKAYGIPKRTIEDWEGGRRKAPEYVMTLLCRAVEQDIQPRRK